MAAKVSGELNYHHNAMPDFSLRLMDENILVCLLNSTTFSAFFFLLPQKTDRFTVLLLFFLPITDGGETFEHRFTSPVFFFQI